MKAKDIMTKDPACCTPDAPLEEVARMMCENNCGEIPVVAREGGELEGVVTDRDITCRSVARGKNPLEMRASDCMTDTCVTATPETGVDELVELLEIHQIRRIPIVDERRAVLGIVSQADIARHGSREQTAELVQEVSRPGRG